MKGWRLGWAEAIKRPMVPWSSLFLPCRFSNNPSAWMLLRQRSRSSPCFPRIPCWPGVLASLLVFGCFWQVSCRRCSDACVLQTSSFKTGALKRSSSSLSVVRQKKKDLLTTTREKSKKPFYDGKTRSKPALISIDGEQ